MEENTAVKESMDVLKQLWRHRKGINILGKQINEITILKKKIYLEHDIPGTIMDVIDVLWPTPEPRPMLTHKSRTLNVWHLIFTLPPGVSFKDVLNRQDYFADACRANLEIKRKGGYVHMNINTARLESFYPYTWNQGLYQKMDLPIPIGYSPRLEVLDLADAPHLLVAGITGFGKSNFLLVLIHSLLGRAKIAIIDMKRLQFSYLKNHCALAKNESDALQLMKALNREMDRRIDILEEAECEKIQDYKGEMEHIVLVIDEVAEIGDPKTIHYIDRVVRMARATGISVVAATQRPSKKVQVFKDDTRDMFAARLCYLMPDEVSSRMVLGETCSLAAQLPEMKGRGIYKFGVSVKEVQSMCLPMKEAKKLLKGQEANPWKMTETVKKLPPR